MNARRQFLSRAGMTVAAAVTAVLHPGVRTAAALLPRAPLPLASPVGEWHVDDMWGPRYVEVTPAASDAGPADFSAAAHPADHPFLPGT